MERRGCGLGCIVALLGLVLSCCLLPHLMSSIYSVVSSVFQVPGVPDWLWGDWISTWPLVSESDTLYMLLAEGPVCCAGIIALLIVWMAQAGGGDLQERTFRTVVLFSLIPAVLAVLSLAFIARDVSVTTQRELPRFAFRSLGKPFVIFMVIVGIFDLGNSSDAFLVLRAQERGLSIVGVLAMLITFNLVYTLVSTPAGSLSDRIGRRPILLSSGLIGVVGIVLLYFSRDYAQILLSGAFIGLASGAFLSTSWALATDLAPEGEEAKYLGLTNLAMAAGSALARLIGPVIDFFNTVSTNLGYSVMLLVCFICLIAGSVLLMRIKIRS